MFHDLLLADADFGEVFQQVFHGWGGSAAWKYKGKGKKNTGGGNLITFSCFRVVSDSSVTCPHSPPVCRAEESHDRVRCNKDPGGCNLLDMVQVRMVKCQLVSCSSALLSDPPLSSVCCAPCSVLRASNGGLVGHALLSGGENKTLLVSFLLETSLSLARAEAAFEALA